MFPCRYYTCSHHQNVAPPTSHGDSAARRSASENFSRRFRTNAKLFTQASVSQCSGPSCRSRACRIRRRSGSSSAKAPRAASTLASLSRWDRGREHFLTRLRGIFLGPNSEKPILSNSRFRNVSISLELSFVL